MTRFSIEDIELYLAEIERAVRTNQCRIELNENRQENLGLFSRYVLDEQAALDIILNLEATDFSEVLKNTKPGYEHERLYVFGKDVPLLERMGDRERTVTLYIKFNRLENGFVIVVSFHEGNYPINYFFK